METMSVRVPLNGLYYQEQQRRLNQSADAIYLPYISLPGRTRIRLLIVGVFRTNIKMLNRGVLKFIRQANQDCFALDSHWVRLNILACRPAQYFTSTNIKLRSVPGAGQHFAIKFALVKWPTDMGTIISKSINTAIYLSQANRLTINFHSHQLTIIQIIKFCNFYKVRHEPSSTLAPSSVVKSAEKAGLFFFIIIPWPLQASQRQAAVQNAQ